MTFGHGVPILTFCIGKPMKILNVGGGIQVGSMWDPHGFRWDPARDQVGSMWDPYGFEGDPARDQVGSMGDPHGLQWDPFFLL